MSTLVANERRKLLATALNNLGVASVVTGGIVPATAYLLGTLRIEGLVPIGSSIAGWSAVGAVFMVFAQLVLRRLQ